MARKRVKSEGEKAAEETQVKIETVKLEDYSDYEEYVKKPARCLAKRLTEDEEIDVVINGIPDKLRIQAGNYRVVTLTPKGNVSKITGYSEEEFKDTWHKPETQGKLVFTKPA